jgi:hypothetical protein
MKASPLRAGMNRFKYFKKIFSLSMATTLLPSSIEGFMGLREKHPVCSKLFILFFNEDPLLILSDFGILRKINGGGSLCHLTAPHMRYVAPNQLRGTMNRFEKGTLDLFKAGRKSVVP